MAKHIASSFDKNAAAKSARQKQHEQLAQQWRDLRNKLDSLLRANNVLKTNDARTLCAAMDDMSFIQRSDHISQYWGPLYLKKAEPILHQLELLEQTILESNKT